ncbi:MAG: N-acetyltransferase family protein [Granulosicoccus sp.]
MNSVVVRELQLTDRGAWEELARGYKEFYKTPTSDSEYDHVWLRLLERQEIYSFCAVQNKKVVGIVHYLFHTTVWEPRSCYLQDLFTSTDSRGKGVARSLIEAVAEHAKDTECDRLYWNTQTNNEKARILYDKLAEFRGFIRYDYSVKSS